MIRLPAFPSWTIRLFQIAVMAAIFGLLWYAVDWAEALKILFAAKPLWLAAAFLALTLQTVLSAQRWRLTAAQLGIIIGRWQAVREYYLSQVVNQSMPGGFVGDASRAVRTRGQVGLYKSGQAVVFERLAGQLGLLAIVLIALPTALTSSSFDGPEWFTTAIKTAFVVLAGVMTGGVVLYMFGPPIAAIDRFFKAMFHALAARNVLVMQISLSLATALLNLTAFSLCAKALGVDIAIWAVMALVPLVLFAMLVPVSISGWGVREGAAVVILPIAGLTASEAIATSVAFGLTFVITILPGFVLIWWGAPNHSANVR